MPLQQFLYGTKGFLMSESELWITERQTPDLSLSIKVKEILFRKRSPFQEILMVDSYQFGKVLFLEGTFQTTEKDEFFYHEMITHVPLFSHPKPEEILVIGGGDGGTLREILKHRSIKEAVLVEIDKDVVEVSKRFLPFYNAFQDERRFRIEIGDGIKYVADHTNKFDVIIVDSTDPVGPAEGLFSKEFYENCYRALKADGILVAQSESPFLHTAFIKEIKNTIDKIFPISMVYTTPVPTYPSGYWSFTTGSKVYNPSIPQREPDFETRYYTPEIHRASFVLPKFMKDAGI